MILIAVFLLSFGERVHKSMAWFDGVANFFGYQKAQINRVPAWLSAEGESERYAIPERSLPDAQLELYQRLAWVQIAVAAVAETASIAKFNVAKLMGEDSEQQSNHPFELLLRRPNPLQSRFELLVSTFSYLALTGNCYWWLNRVGNDLQEIWVLPANKIKPVPDEHLYLRGYIYEPNNGIEVPLDINDVVHFRRWHPHNSFVGLSPVEAFAIDAEGELAMQKWNTNLFAKDNAKLPGALAFTDPIDDSTWLRMKDEINRLHGGTNRKLMMLRNVGSGVNWIPMAMSQNDMQFLQGRTFTKEEIFAIYAPGYASMLAVNATEANSVAGKATFIGMGVWPKMVQVAEKITNDILPTYGDNIVGEFEDIRPADKLLALQEQTAAERLHTVDELRAKFYNAKPMGDERGGLFLVELAKLSPNPEPVVESIEQDDLNGSPSTFWKEDEKQPKEKVDPKDKPEEDKPEDQPKGDAPAKALKAAQVKARTSVMIALFMPSSVSVQLADLQRLLPVVAEPVPASELHLTLAMLGEAVGFDESRLADLRNTLNLFLANRLPLLGRLNGLGRFHNAETSGTDVLYASFDSKQLPEFRQSLSDALTLAGFELPSEHGFIPHVTLGYVPRESITPMLALPQEEMIFTELWLTVAGEMSRFLFELDVDAMPSGLPFYEPAKRAERKAFKAWLKKRPTADIHTFKAVHLSHDELHEIASEIKGVATEQPFFDWTGEITPSVIKAMILQLSPDDDEAEQKIRDALEKRTARNIDKAFTEMMNTFFPEGYGEHIDPNVEAAKIGKAFREEQALRDAVSRGLIDGVDLGISVAVNQLESGLGFGFDYTMAHEQARAWAHRYTDEILQQLGTTSGRLTGQALTRWIDNGESLDALINDLEPVFGRKRAASIAATEVTRAYSNGTREAYRESGVIQRLEYRASRDELVCPICGPLHGQRTDINGTFNGLFPPLHPNCRCWIVPVVDNLSTS